MKQLLQNLRNGATEVADVPCPAPGRGQVLVRTRRTLVSAGTERMLVDFGRAGWIEKARQQPDKVRMVLDKVRTDGLLPALDAVRSKLDQPLPLGYCNVGEVVAVRPREASSPPARIFSASEARYISPGRMARAFRNIRAAMEEIRRRRGIRRSSR